MSPPVTLRPRAEADLAEAFDWYEQRIPGLGRVFLRAVDACIARIQSHPEAYPQPLPRIRRAPLRRFPYGVFYVFRDGRIDVLAIYHAHRRPRAFES